MPTEVTKSPEELRKGMRALMAAQTGQPTFEQRRTETPARPAIRTEGDLAAAFAEVYAKTGLPATFIVPGDGPNVLFVLLTAIDIPTTTVNNVVTPKLLNAASLACKIRKKTNILAEAVEDKTFDGYKVRVSLNRKAEEYGKDRRK